MKCIENLLNVAYIQSEHAIPQNFHLKMQILLVQPTEKCYVTTNLKEIDFGNFFSLIIVRVVCLEHGSLSKNLL